MNNNNNKFNEATYKTLDEALELITQAVRGEREDELFYEYLISVAPTQEEKEIIADIRDDEMKHNRMFREIYEYYTGFELARADRQEFTEPASYLEGIKRALFGELAAMERYRIIYAGLPSRYYRDMVLEIMTDELKHADKYNYILNLNLENGNGMNSGQLQSQSQGLNQGQEKGQMDEGQSMTLEQVLEYIDPIVNEAMKEAEAGTDLRKIFQKYILIGILIGNGYSTEQGAEQVKAWENENYI